MFKITPEIEYRLVSSTPKQKAEDALKAIALLKSGAERFTQGEKEAIALMPGFGTLRQTLQAGLDEEYSGFKAAADEKLRELLTPEEYRRAREASLNAFHTSPEIARAIWRCVQHLGFTGGKIVEPGAGSGIFIGTAPEEVRNESEFTLVEQDSVSCQVLKALYPEAQLFDMPFQKAQLLYGGYDLAIGNVPFGSEKVSSKDDLASLHLSLHNYFIAKAVQLVRPGGLISLITSTYTLDAHGSQSFREWLGGHVEEVKVKDGWGEQTKVIVDTTDAKVRLLGAVRLPSNAFKGNARTEVSTDILFFSRLEREEDANPKEWVISRPTGASDREEDYATHVNSYFYEELRQAIRNRRSGTPKMLGTPCKNKLYGRGLALSPSDEFEPLTGCIERVVSEWIPCYTKGDGSDFRLQTPPELQSLPNLCFCEWGDRLWRKSLDGTYVEEIHNNKERIQDFLVVRRLLDALLNAQNTLVKDESVEPFRKALAVRFNEFRKKWGSPNTSTNKRVFNGDPKYVPVRALEIQKGKVFEDAPILHKRTSYPALEPKSAKNPVDALNKSLGHKGRMDLDWMASLLNAPREQVAAYLNQKSLIFYDPALGDWVVGDEYLSGNVRRKLAIAREHDLQRNIDALINALPLPCVPPVANVETKIEVAIACDWDYSNKTPDEQQRLIENEIQAELGAVWIPSDVVQEFVNQLLNAKRISVRYQPSPISKWAIDDGYGEGNRTAARKQYGTDNYTPVEIILRTLNANDLRVYYTDTEGKRHLDTEGTEAARGKQEQICQLFTEWLWSEPERAKRVAIQYNQECNSLAYRRWDGDYLVFPGVNQELLDKYPNRPHQNRAIAQIIASPVTHLPHPVGYGKAQPTSAKILTPTGWKRMGDIHVGDYVISVDGTPTKVIGVYPQGLKEIFKVSFSDESSTECCDEHFWLTQTYLERNNASKAKKLGKDWNCAKPKVRTLKEIRETLISNHRGAKNHSIPMVSPVHFDEGFLPLHPYLLGVILGDGSTAGENASITCHDDDIEIIERCRRLLPENVKLTPWKNRSKKTTRTYGFSATKRVWLGWGKRQKNAVSSACKKLGLLRKTAEHKFIPDLYKFSSVESRIELLRGLMDTDGSVFTQGDACGLGMEFSSTSRRLAEDVAFLVQSLGGTAIVRPRDKNTFTHKGEKREGLPSFRVAICLPNEINPFHMARKRDIVKTRVKYFPVRYITGVESVGEKEAQCIAVEHPSHLYVTDDFIVTHNTRVLQMGAMRLRQLGICKKPVIVGLKSTIPQLEASFRELYPTANLLVPDTNSFNRENRQLFTSLIATGDWDCIIMSHQQFEKLMMSAEYVQQYYQDILDEVEDFIKDLKSDGGDNRVLIKNMVAVQKRTEARLEKAIEATSKDQHISFEALGIDAVLIDEFHLYKNLHYMTSRSGVAGLPNSNSNRAQDTYMKLMWLINQPLLDLGGQGKRVVTATGTPVSNSLAEMFTVMRYHIPMLMRELDIDTFDAFSSLYIKFEAAAELTARGTYKVKERARRFTNVPEMMRVFRSFSNLITGKDKELAEELLCKPDPVFLTIASQPTPAQLKVVDGLVQRAAAIENKLVKPDEDNMLRITGEGRKNSLDSRLLGYDENEPRTKVNQCPLNIWRVWKATRVIKATQVVFCDMSTPKDSGFDVYNYVRNTLVALGIPQEAIAFIHEANTDSKRKTLFDKCNSGEIAVIFGSTEKLGTGVNVQERMIAMHHLDAPWRPSDIEQREGRGVRQGNTMSKVLIFRYVTTGRNGSAGFDAFMWQTLEYKADPVNQVMSGDETIRVIDDASGDALNFAAVKAIASGDERIKELADLQNEEKRLRLQLSAHERDQASVVTQKRYAIARIDELSGDDGTIAKLQADLATVQSNAGKVVIKDQELEEVPGEGIVKMFEAMEKRKTQKPAVIGMFHGLKLTAILGSFTGTFRLTLKGQTVTVIEVEKKSHRTPKWIKASLDAESIAAEIQGAIDACTRSLEDCHRNLMEFEDVIGKPFPKRDRLEFVTARVKELQDIFMKEEQARMSAKQEEAEQEAEEGDEEDFWCQSVSTISPIPDNALISELKKQPYEPVVVNDGETEKEVDWLAMVDEMVCRMSAIDVHSEEVRDNVIEFPVKKAMWGVDEAKKKEAIGR